VKRREKTIPKPLYWRGLFPVLAGLAWMLSAILLFAYAMHRSRVGTFAARGLPIEAIVTGKASTTVAEGGRHRTLRVIHLEFSLDSGQRASGAVSEFLSRKDYEAVGKDSRLRVRYLPESVRSLAPEGTIVEEVLLESSIAQVRRRSPAMIGGVLLAAAGGLLLLFRRKNTKAAV